MSVLVVFLYFDDDMVALWRPKIVVPVWLISRENMRDFLNDRKQADTFAWSTRCWFTSCQWPSSFCLRNRKPRDCRDSIKSRTNWVFSVLLVCCDGPKATRLRCDTNISGRVVRPFASSKEDVNVCRSCSYQVVQCILQVSSIVSSLRRRKKYFCKI